MNFTDEEKQAAWEKAEEVPGHDPDIRRKDACGAWIKWDLHGKQRGNPISEGWEIDHITPKAKDGEDDIDNLRALQWKNNRLKSDGRLPRTKCVTAVGNVNVDNSVDDDTDD